jgi:hypothetical protein
MNSDVPQQKSTLWIIFLLLLIIVVGSVFAVGSLNIAGTTHVYAMDVGRMALALDQG